jgi:catechol 2,3-dioxygenase-like lactoylglutathione lyase family enzyme
MKETLMRAFAVERIDHVVLRVADLERSIAFYTQVLEFTVARRRDDLGLIHLRAGASMVDIVALEGRLGKRGGRGPGLEGRNVDHVCLRVEPFDEAAIVAHLNACGLPTPERATVNFGAEGDGPSLYIKDPDGNTIELKGPAAG